jgi:hypothetical protein
MDQDDVEEPVEDRLLAGLRGRQFAGEQADGIVQWVVIGVGQMEHGWERFDELATDVTSELVRTAKEHGRLRIACVLVARVLSSEIVCGQADDGGIVGDAVIETTPDERDIARGELACRLWIVEPHPGMAPDHGVYRELDGAGQAQPPRGSSN